MASIPVASIPFFLHVATKDKSFGKHCIWKVLPWEQFAQSPTTAQAATLA